MRIITLFSDLKLLNMSEKFTVMKLHNINSKKNNSNL